MAEKPIGPGDLEHLIDFQKPAEVKTPAGRREVTWHTQFQEYARCVPTGSTERFREGAERTGTLYRVTVHAGLAIDETWRILWDGLVLNIRSVPKAPPSAVLVELIAESGVTT